jgi:hypothetical protein
VINLYLEALFPAPGLTSISQPSLTKHRNKVAASEKWHPISSPALRELMKKGDSPACD